MSIQNFSKKRISSSICLRHHSACSLFIQIPNNPELVQVVREGDCVLMPQGYHPNVAAPGGQINFLWMMAAVKEGEDRFYGVVNVQPEYAAGGSGFEAVSDKK